MKTPEEVAIKFAKQSSHSYTKVDDFKPHKWVVDAMKEYAKQLLEEYTNRIVENADITYTQEKTFDFTEVDKESITSQLPLFLKEIGYGK